MVGSQTGPSCSIAFMSRDGGPRGDDWLAQWFSQRGVKIERADPSLNYLELGWVDSFGLMQLIMDIESEVGAQVPGEKLQDPAIQTLGGLAAVIDELASGR